MRANSPETARSGAGRSLAVLLLLCSIAASFPTLAAQPRTALRGHVSPQIRNFQPIARIDPAQKLRLAVGLPVRDPAGLAQFVADVSTPGSPSFRRFLTSGEFTQRFGPTAADYQAVEDYAAKFGLSVVAKYDNRMVMDVEGAAGDVEKAFQVRINVYQHPTEARTFIAPDTEPSVEAGVPILDITGLNTHTLPKPASRHGTVPAGPTPDAGGGSGGSYKAYDIRQAYAQGVSLTGAGQRIGLLEFDGFYTNDIAKYRTVCGIHNVPITTVLIDGFDGVPTTGANSGNGEVALDIQMAMALAPGLVEIRVYETSASGAPNSILARMASENLAAQLSVSWTFGTTPDSTTDQLLQEFIAQGQSYFNASGDSDAIIGAAQVPTDSPYVTCVGGTTLSTTGPGGVWSGEVVWNQGSGAGSGGGVSIQYTIPSWQRPVSMTSNQGSTSHRNYPDVAALADNVFTVADNGVQSAVGGTSVAAPLWAGITAMINQKAASVGQPRVGFLNPAIYQLGLGNSYATTFHDVKTGNNQKSGTGAKFSAQVGYDLATGWGTPKLPGLINALYLTDTLGVTPSAGLSAYGYLGGPFTPSSATYAVTNSATDTINWVLGPLPVWLNASATAGTNNPGDPADLVTLSLNDAATNLNAGNHSATVYFTNLNTGFVYSRTASITIWPSLVQNGGFETGDFSFWDLVGPQATTYNFADGSTDVKAHNGKYAAALGQNVSETGGTATLSQWIPTVPGQEYVIAFWYESVPYQGSTTPNQLQMSWDNNVLFTTNDMPVLGWHKASFAASATTNSTLLQFLFSDDPSDIGLDDVTVYPVPSPDITSASLAGGLLTLNWATAPGLNYQVQYTTNFIAGSWQSLGGAVTATATSATTSDTPTSDAARFYRVMLNP
jgi:subtilase family serine protease